MGKLRHKGFKSPAHFLQPEPAPQQPHPCSLGGHCQPLLLGDPSCESERSRTALEEQKQDNQSPLLHPAPARIVRSRRDSTSKREQLAAGVSQAGSRGVPAPDGQRPAHGLPCLRCPHGLGLCSLPEPRQQSRDAALLPAPSKEGDVRGHGGCREHQRWRCVGAGTPLEHPRAGSTFPSAGASRRGGIAWGGEEPVPSQAYPGAAGSLQSKACSRRAAPAILTRPFFFAVPSMPHGGRFPRAAAPALLHTVH